jgi:hypothetical protein
MFTQKEYNRIFSKISIDPVTQCWNWTGGLDNGYGRIYWRGHRYKAHRLIYIWKYGSIPEWVDKNSKEADHICNNRKCVNPDHLQLVSNKINILRGNTVSGINSRKTLCIHGHDALYVVGNRRRCRECRRILDASEKRKKWKKEHAK